MADLRKLDAERVYFEVEEPNLGATFRERTKHVRAWRWAPQFKDGAIVREDGMARLVDGEGAHAVDMGAWLHPSGVIIPDNGNPAYVWARVGQIRPAIGDVIIKHADGMRTVMSPAQFVQEYEPE